MPFILKGKTRKLIRLKTCEILPNPFNTFKDYDIYELNSLANSIRLNGVLQPIIVRKNKNGQYEVVAGERRLRAATMAGEKEIDCIETLAKEENSAFISFDENIRRRNLNLFEEAEFLESLITTYSLSQKELASRLFISPSTLSNKLRLLKFTEKEREIAINSGLSEKQLRYILKINNEEIRLNALKLVAEKGYNCEKTENYINLLLNSNKKNYAPPRVCDLRILENTLVKTIESIKRAGFIVETQKEDNEDFAIFKIKIRKAKS